MGFVMDKEPAQKEDWRITLRLPKRDYCFIQKLVDDGEYTNPADVVRDAVKRFRADMEMRVPIQNKGVPALWIFSEEIGQKDFLDWFSAHTSFMLPIHHYRGELRVFDDALVFYGKNTKTDKTEISAVSFQNIKSVYLGFDGTYKRRETLGGFDHEAPLRIEYKDNNSTKTVYAFIEFDRITRSNKNQEWFEALKRVCNRMKTENNKREC
jgi:Arc/MetJ-type ribon-helix-helix transcriptional regulator